MLAEAEAVVPAETKRIRLECSSAEEGALTTSEVSTPEMAKNQACESDVIGATKRKIGDNTADPPPAKTSRKEMRTLLISILVKEVEKEVSWLSNRGKPTGGLKWHVPSCLSLYGCTTGKVVVPDIASRVCECNDGRLLSSFLPDLSPSTPLQPSPYPRRRTQYVTLHTPLHVFGDGVDLKLHPWRFAQPATTTPAMWLVPPGPADFVGTIVQCATDIQSMRFLLGQPEPIPPLYYHSTFFVPRCRVWHCPVHVPVRVPAAASREEKAFAMIGWSGSEPMSVPPICSCTQTQKVKQWVNALLVAADKTNVSSNFLAEQEQELLYSAEACKTCGGLTYYPYSFIEVLLSSHVSSLTQFLETYPIPPNTDVTCDGPHLSATIVCRSPEHEWNCFRAIACKKPARPPIIYDVCSGVFTPGQSTRPGNRRSSNEDTPTRPFAPTVLKGPSPHFLNCRKAVPLTVGVDESTLSITTVAARRPYCLIVRKYEVEEAYKVALSQCDGCEDIVAHAGETTEYLQNRKEREEIRRNILQIDVDLESLRLECLAIELCGTRRE